MRYADRVTRLSLFTRRGGRDAWKAWCGWVFCVLALYLSHTLFGGGLGHLVTSACADGLGAAPTSEEQGSLYCVETGLTADAVLPRAQDNDPYLAFLSLFSGLSPLPTRTADARPRFRPAPHADRRPDLMNPLLRVLAQAAHILC